VVILSDQVFDAHVVFQSCIIFPEISKNPCTRYLRDIPVVFRKSLKPLGETTFFPTVSFCQQSHRGNPDTFGFALTHKLQEKGHYKQQGKHGTYQTSQKALLLARKPRMARRTARSASTRYRRHRG
jgi:hypothetical protein